MADIEELKRRVDKAAEIENTLDRRLWVLGVITEAMSPHGITPILVGGGAVEFYTFGNYTTYDIDVVMPTARAVDLALADLGFEKSGRYWAREDLDIVLEAPGSGITGDADRVRILDVEGMPVHIICVEDLIIDRLNAYVHWKSKEDGRWAERLIAIHSGSLDWGYLEAVAEREQVAEALSELRQIDDGKD